ncbi:nitronate monooxygenase [Corynebacterium sp. sy039]|uniref:nitronate monooxygenase n=1 Tax=Corynebacterium sp. sy039 TaxID=2599641 RepID=UPI001FEEBE88|nr:nitronate monooxygenase [Corynebacterium sp. sy039]
MHTTAASFLEQVGGNETARIIAAPMAGGPSTPHLVHSVTQAGALGFLASGNISAAQLVANMQQLRELSQGTPGHYGVNFFCRQEQEVSAHTIAALAPVLADAYAHAHSTCTDDDDTEYVVPTPRALDYSNEFDDKFAAVLDARAQGYGPRIVSSSFGSFTPSEIAQLHEVGIYAWVSVTSPQEARQAQENGADALIVQGKEAGGHQLTWSMTAEPAFMPVAELLPAVAEITNATIPLIAAGGVRNACDVARLCAFNAVQAVSCGSVFLLATEAGTSADNRALLEKGGETILSRAFSGRYARGLATTFSRSQLQLPPSYPYLSVMLKPLRSHPDFSYCLVGEDVHSLAAQDAAGIVAELSQGLAQLSF